MQVFKPFFINFILLGLLWSRRASPSACGDRRAGQGGRTAPALFLCETCLIINELQGIARSYPLGRPKDSSGPPI